MDNRRADGGQADRSGRLRGRHCGHVFSDLLPGVDRQSMTGMAAGWRKWIDASDFSDFFGRIESDEAARASIVCYSETKAL